MCSALLALGSAGESLDFLEWLADRLAETDSPDRLRPLYPLVGDQFVPEAVIPTLAGYRGSRPVRVGNLAEHQLQLDTFGPVVDLVWRLSDHDASLVSPGHLDTVAAMVRAIATRWTEPDHGIWEDRRAPRRHVHSIAMCWMGVARAIDVFTRCGATVPDHWVGLADDIRKDLLDNGWNAGERAFTVAYGEPDIDAALLEVATCGILDPTDPRVIATVEAVEGALRDGATVRRIAHDDGLPGREGSFLVCTTWLVEALWAIGRRHDARELLRQFAAFAGQVGLFPEEVDARSGAGLGNFPQGYSHAGLIQAWVRINGGSTNDGRHGASPRPIQGSQ